jgi:hypothetical protein
MARLSGLTDLARNSRMSSSASVGGPSTSTASKKAATWAQSKKGIAIGQTEVQNLA